MSPRLRMLVLPAMLFSACAGCRPLASDQAHTAGADASARVPALRAVLHWENVLAGKNQARADYQARVNGCEKAGIPVTPLAPADVEKLDAGRIEIAINASRRHVRQTAWTLGFDENDGSVAGSCRFHLAEDVVDGDVDHVDGMFEPLQAGASRGSYPGWTAMTEDTVGGQPCRRWRKSADAGAPEEICMWSGGQQWGFDDGPVGLTACHMASADDYMVSIPLEATPLEGSGCIVRVESFSVGTDRPAAEAATRTGAAGGRR